MSYPQLLTPEEMLTQGKDRLGIPQIVVICGSTRFMDAMTDADRELTFAGHIVVKPGCDMKQPHPLWADPLVAERAKKELDALHRAKIRLADSVLVVGDYIGDSTRSEIAYARSLGKPVTFTHPEVDPDRTAAQPPREPDSDCHRCDGTGLDPDRYTKQWTTDGNLRGYRHEPCSECLPAPAPACTAGLLPHGSGPVDRCVVRGSHDDHRTAAGGRWTDADSEVR